MGFGSSSQWSIFEWQSNCNPSLILCLKRVMSRTLQWWNETFLILKKSCLMSMHKHEIRNMFLGKGRIDVHLVMEIRGIHLFSPRNHAKNDTMESNSRKCCSGKLRTLVVSNCGMSEDRFPENLRTQDHPHFETIGHLTPKSEKMKNIFPEKNWRSASGGEENYSNMNNWQSMNVVHFTHHKVKTGYSSQVFISTCHFSFSKDESVLMSSCFRISRVTSSQVATIFFTFFDNPKPTKNTNVKKEIPEMSFFFGYS